MRRFILSSLIVSSLTLLISSTALASFLVVDLKTNYLPGVEFTTARTILNSRYTQNTPVITTSPVEDPGIRIADYRDLRNGHYNLVVQLLRSDESILDTRTISVTLDTNVMTVAVFARPGDRGGPSIQPSPAGIVAPAPVFTPPLEVSLPGVVYVYPGRVGTVEPDTCVAGAACDTGDPCYSGTVICDAAGIGHCVAETHITSDSCTAPESPVLDLPSDPSPVGDSGGDVAPSPPIPATDGEEEVIVPSDDEPTSPESGEMTTPVGHPISPRPERTPIEVTFAQGGGCNLAAGPAGDSSQGIFVLLLVSGFAMLLFLKKSSTSEARSFRIIVLFVSAVALVSGCEYYRPTEIVYRDAASSTRETDSEIVPSGEGTRRSEGAVIEGPVAEDETVLPSGPSVADGDGVADDSPETSGTPEPRAVPGEDSTAETVTERPPPAVGECVEGAACTLPGDAEPADPEYCTNAGYFERGRMETADAWESRKPALCENLHECADNIFIRGVLRELSCLSRVCHEVAGYTIDPRLSGDARASLRLHLCSRLVTCDDPALVARKRAELSCPIL